MASVSPTKPGANLYIYFPQNMHILLAPDKFKGALSADGVCQAMAKGVRRAFPDVRITSFPLADGGEGSAEIFCLHTHGHKQSLTVSGPLGQPVTATYSLSGDGKTAFVEMAQASGLALLPEAARDPMRTSTLGTGELIRDAMEKGATRLLLGIGGSATNDAGMGMAAALGYEFLDAEGQVLQPVGAALEQLAEIRRRAEAPDLSGLQVEVACDVTNPLYGPQGAAEVYAPQKGADAAAVARLDAGLRQFAGVVAQWQGKDVASTPGAGAAGGLGFGALVFLQAELRSGIELLMQATQFEQALVGVDLVLTGEGKMDEQTLQGKVVCGVARAARKAGIPVAALCGTQAASPAVIEQLGLAFAASILDRPQDLETAMAATAAGLEKLAFSVGKLFFAGH
jgi:glycerate 2-kinase